MNTLLQLAVGNALLATVLALLAAVFGRVCRRPALVHCLWLLVLLKLITPSLVKFPIPWPDLPESSARPSDSAATKHQPELLCNPHQPEAPAKVAANPSLALQAAKQAVAPAIAPVWNESLENYPSTDPVTPDIAAALDKLDATRAQVASIPWSSWILAFWFVGSAAWLILTTYRIYRFHQLLRCAHPASPRVREQAEQLAKRLGLVVAPAVCLVPGKVSPMVWPVGIRPRLFIPAALWERLTEEQQCTLLLHELAHLRRRDQWVRGLELVVTLLYWWHPVVWWACREIREAEEQCCDAWVVWSLPQAARAYATALLATLDFLSETDHALPAVASGIGHVHDLRRRLTMIMHGTTPRALSGTGLALVLGLGAMLLPLLPTWAQERERDPGPRPERSLTADAAPRDTEKPDRVLNARAEMADARTEVEQLRAQTRRLQKELEEAERRLEAATERLATMQDREEPRERGRERFRPPAPQKLPPTPRREGARDSEQRLSALEQRLDALLAEVQSLRREMRGLGVPGRRPGMPGPGRPVPAPPASGLPGIPAVPPVPSIAPVAPAAPAPPAAALAPLSPDTVPQPPSAPPATPRPEAPR